MSEARRNANMKPVPKVVCHLPASRLMQTDAVEANRPDCPRSSVLSQRVLRPVTLIDRPSARSAPRSHLLRAKGRLDHRWHLGPPTTTEVAVRSEA